MNRYTLTKLKNLPTFGGVSESAPGALPASIADLAQIDKTLNDPLVPEGGRVAVVSSALNAALPIDSDSSEGEWVWQLTSLRRGICRQRHEHGFRHVSGHRQLDVPAAMTSAAVNGAVSLPVQRRLPRDGASGATVTLRLAA